MVHSVSGWTRGVQVKLWDPFRTRAIPERLRDVFTTRRYTNTRLPLPTFTLTEQAITLKAFVRSVRSTRSGRSFGTSQARVAWTRRPDDRWWFRLRWLCTELRTTREPASEAGDVEDRMIEKQARPDPGRSLPTLYTQCTYASSNILKSKSKKNKLRRRRNVVE